MLPDFAATVGALAATVAEREQSATGSPQTARDFVLASFAAMPFYLRSPLRAATLIFDLWPLFRRGRPFHALPPAQRRAQMQAWEAGPARMLMRFYVSLSLVSLWHD
jgi:hypothetical protein